MSETRTGACNCGSVRFRVSGPLRPVVYCHCEQCRRQTGHFVAATQAGDGDLVIEGEEALTWYAASDAARRGFCATCGSVMFWKANGSGRTSIMAGIFDRPSGLVESHHIYCAEKGDYYDIRDGLEQYPGAD